MHALHLFAENGFQRTSTRAIAALAKVNISAISYYFGDKAGLYRAVFVEPLGKPSDDIALFSGDNLTLEQALDRMFNGFIEPFKQGELSKLCMRLHMREMVEPTGMWEQEIDNSIAPHHQALLNVLKKHLGLSKVDADLQRLAFCIVGMAVHLLVGRDVADRLTPNLFADETALDLMHARLTLFAMAMIKAESERRNNVLF
jgi:AcrR family transcriptional regulator